MGLWDTITSIPKAIGSATGFTGSANTPQHPDMRSTDYGGVPGGANAATSRFQGLGADQTRLNAAQADYAQANQDRNNAAGARNMQLGAYGQQQNAADMYQRMANGQGPSLATALMQNGMGNIVAGQNSAAASARGPAGLALAQQNAAGNIANQQQQLNQAAGQMRMQEQLAAMGGYANQTNALQGAAGGIRSGDYQGQGLSAQEAQFQAQLQAQQQLANQQAQLQYEQLGQQAQGMQLNANQGANATAAGMYGADQGAASGDKDRFSKLLGGIVSGGGSAGASALTSGTAGAGAAGGLGPLALLSDERQKTDIEPAGAGAEAPTFRGEPGADGSEVAQRAPVVEDLNTLHDKDGEVEATDVAWSHAPDKALADRRERNFIARVAAGNVPGFAHLLSMAQGLGAASTPDKTAVAGALKREPSPAPLASAPYQMLDVLQPYQYRYKPGTGMNPSVPRYGVMAQDLERSPMGASLVRDTPQGKQIDTNQAAAANLAANAELHQRIKALEAALAARRGGG